MDFVLLLSDTASYLSVLTRTSQYYYYIIRLTGKPKMDFHINNFSTIRSELTLEHYSSYYFNQLYLFYESIMKWYMVFFHVLSVLVVFIVFYSYRYSRIRTCYHCFLS